MASFSAGDRVRIRRGARVSVQPGVGPGMAGTVLDPQGWEPRAWHEGMRGEPLYLVRFDGFGEHDVVEESCLEMAE